MALQQRISHEWNCQWIEQTIPVLIDERQGEMAIGRTPYDAVEVDNLVYVSDPQAQLQVGEIYPVRVVDAAEYDLWAVPL
jgi:ribosomal protein S12 methylthiotransferase